MFRADFPLAGCVNHRHLIKCGIYTPIKLQIMCCDVSPCVCAVGACELNDENQCKTRQLNGAVSTFSGEKFECKVNLVKRGNWSECVCVCERVYFPRCFRVCFLASDD